MTQVTINNIFQMSLVFNKPISLIFTIYNYVIYFFTLLYLFYTVVLFYCQVYIKKDLLIYYN